MRNKFLTIDQFILLLGMAYIAITNHLTNNKLEELNSAFLLLRTENENLKKTLLDINILKEKLAVASKLNEELQYRGYFAQFRPTQPTYDVISPYITVTNLSFLVASILILYFLYSLLFTWWLPLSKASLAIGNVAVTAVNNTADGITSAANAVSTSVEQASNAVVAVSDNASTFFVSLTQDASSLKGTDLNNNIIELCSKIDPLSGKDYVQLSVWQPGSTNPLLITDIGKLMDMASRLNAQEVGQALMATIRETATSVVTTNTSIDSGIVLLNSATEGLF